MNIKDLTEIQLKMIDDLYECQERNGSYCSRDKYRQIGSYSQHLFKKHFGTYNNFYQTMLVVKESKQEKNIKNINNIDDVESKEMNIQLQKKIQKLNDINRIERKEFRNQVKLDNSLEELYKSLINEISKQKLSHNNFKFEPINEEKVGIVQLSDLHLNEKIDLSMFPENNVFDYDVAKRRLNYFANKSIERFKKEGINKVIIANTGDTINSSKKITELVNNIYPAGKALCESFVIIKDFIQLFADYFYVDYYTVVGNETRLESSHHNENYFDSFHTANNYDYMIHHLLKVFFNIKNVNIQTQEDYKEHVITVLGKNLLLKHGEDLKTMQMVDRTISKYARKGKVIYAIMIGHVHDPSILGNRDLWRSGSLSGGNDWSNKNLDLSSKATQNNYIADKNGIDATSIDLTHII